MTTERLVKPWKPAPQQTYVFRGAHIVDPVSGSILRNQSVKISGGLVEWVGGTEEDYIIVPTGKDIVVELKGKYLCPGLIDNHVHLAAVPGEKNLGDLFALDREVTNMRQSYVCQQMLRRGFTSARDCGGATLALKEAINDGVIQGPRLSLLDAH